MGQVEETEVVRLLITMVKGGCALVGGLRPDEIEELSEMACLLAELQHEAERLVALLEEFD